jgi:magnesium transporter
MAKLKPRPLQHRRIKRYHAPGTPPGTLIQPDQASAPQCRALCYGPTGLHESSETLSCVPPEDWSGILWLDIAGLPGEAELAQLRDRLGLHPLALEDVITGGQRPKLDDLGEMLFLVLTRPRWQADELRSEQVSLFLGERFVLSIHEAGDDLFEPLRRRLHKGGAGLLGGGAERLLHALADLVIDQGFPLLDTLGEAAEAIETALLERPQPEVLARIHRLKRMLLQLRRELWPAREALGRVMRPGVPWISEAQFPYWKDIHDHALYQLELVEAYRDMSAGMLDLYLSSASHRLNDIMRVLTIISTIFIPLTFVTGLYGMNFVVDTASPWAMPLTHWRYGYPAVLAFMTLVAGLMLWFFRRKGWL